MVSSLITSINTRFTKNQWKGGDKNGQSYNKNRHYCHNSDFANCYSLFIGD